MMIYAEPMFLVVQSTCLIPPYKMAVASLVGIVVLVKGCSSVFLTNTPPWYRSF
jgi:hypothetical protein